MSYVRTTLEGTVTRGGEPLARAYVQLRDTDGEFTGEWRTRADGAYQFNLPPGAWNVVVLTAGGAKVEHAVEVAPDGGTRLDIEMEPAASAP